MILSGFVGLNWATQGCLRLAPEGLEFKFVLAWKPWKTLPEMQRTLKKVSEVVPSQFGERGDGAGREGIGADASRCCRSRVRAGFLALAIFVITCGMACVPIATAQTASDNQNAPSRPRSAQNSYDVDLPPVDLKSLPRNLFVDQEKFWTAPFHMTAADLHWAVPAAFAAAALIASDTAIEKHVPTTPSTVSHAVTVSNAGLAAMGALGAGAFLWGHVTNNDQERETGLLSGEAGIDAFVDTEIFGYAFGRQRPLTGNGRGEFFKGGDSFPSQHAAISWAIASVIAHEYPGVLTQVLAYGGATGVSAARFIGQKHFAGDLLVGSALGWYLGRQAFRSHSHYSDAEIARYGTFSKGDQENSRDPKDMGSPYVPLDSWIYPAMERLIALGYIRSADLGMRPWTRMECARLVRDEAAQRIQEDQNASPVQATYDALAAELADETARWNGETNIGVSLDAIYTRSTQIVGTPLHDGLHFGQTIVNDYGRPYGQGFNNVTGFASHALAGPLSFYVRAEYQHAAALPAFSAQAAQTIQGVDGLPTAPPILPTLALNQMDLLEGYIGLQVSNWQITFGKQALWWGEDASGPMLFSNNAEPILMLQINRVQPFKFPVLGSVRLSYLVGRLSGYHWVDSAVSGFTGSWTQSLSDQPFIVGEKVSLKPTSDLELGISITALFGGPGVPATLHKLLQAGFSTGNGAPGTSGDPGDRRGGFDFNYRIPGARNWLSFYADAFTDDEPNPWFAWNKTALTSGLYLSRVPGIPKLDFRVEGVYTDPPGGGATVEHGFFYNNDRFRSGYTNNGNLIGSWIGREGQGADAWATYWLGPKSKVQFNFRHQKVSAQFIPDGGTLTDFGVSADYRVRPTLGLSARVQDERWLFPVIQPNASRNITAAVEILIEPQKLLRYSRSSTSP
jgi:membrane-associated phospholipid phosphatase